MVEVLAAERDRVLAIRDSILYRDVRWWSEGCDGEAGKINCRFGAWSTCSLATRRSTMAVKRREGVVAIIVALIGAVAGIASAWIAAPRAAEPAAKQAAEPAAKEAIALQITSQESRLKTVDKQLVKLEADFLSLSDRLKDSEKHRVSPPESLGGLVWTRARLEPGWSVYGGDYADPSYSKDRLGVVRLRGLAKGGAAGAENPILILPKGFRPDGQAEIGVACAGNQPCEIIIMKSGRVYAETSDERWLSLDNVSFTAAS